MTIIQCNLQNCKGLGENGVCKLGRIKLDDSGMCESYTPIIRCGDCGKYETEQCEYRGLVDYERGYEPSCFVRREA